MKSNLRTASLPDGPALNQLPERPQGPIGCLIGALRTLRDDRILILPALIAVVAFGVCSFYVADFLAWVIHMLSVGDK